MQAKRTVFESFGRIVARLGYLRRASAAVEGSDTGMVNNTSFLIMRLCTSLRRLKLIDRRIAAVMS